LPRDVQTRVKVITSTYDPAQGGFSGAQTSVELDRGLNYALRRAHVTADAALSSPLREQAAGPSRYLPALQASIGGSGALVTDKLFYNGGIQLSQRSVDGIDLLTAGDDRLVLAGIAPDSVVRLRTLLGAPRILLSRPGDDALLSRHLSFIARLDGAPYTQGTHAPAENTWNLVLFGNLAHSGIAAVSPLTTSSRGGSHSAVFGGAQATYSRFVGDVLNETRSSFSVDNERGDAAENLPGGLVAVASVLPDGSSSVASVQFGGNGSLTYSRRAWTWEAINETQWYTKGHPHRVKLTLESRFDGYRRSAADGSLGEFSFSSLAALEAGQPSSFTRMLQSPSRVGGEWSGFAALGDYWNLSPRLQLLYGARLETNRFTTKLPGNPAVEQVFGTVTSRVPERIHVSPRLGFTWYPNGTAGGGFRMNSFAAQSLGPKFMVRGGIGEFRNMLTPASLADASAFTGTADGISRLECLGSATPIPRWDDYARDATSIPASCVDGSAGVFADAAPDVRLLDRTFDAPRSWRANMAVTRGVGPLELTLDATYSLNLNQRSIVDLNFVGVPQFVLPAEQERPVFVQPSSILPSSGLVSTVGARVTDRFDRVLSTRSDLHSLSRQLTLSAAPSSFGRVIYGFAYTLADVQEQHRGFDGTTAGFPTVVETGTGDLDIRHQIQASIGTTLPWDMTIALAGRVSSGLPFTPRVSGDVNGDGFANDRAFLFGPEDPQDSATAAGMRKLLTTAPANVRDCLLSQMGQIASRNSCRGSWQTQLNVQLGLINRYGYTRHGLSVTLNLTNPLAGLDRLVHGPNDLRGWGSGALPDPVLLIPKGFDPSARRFQYDVNPRFGRPVLESRFARSPFRVALDVRIDLGVPIMKQQAIKLLSPGRDEKSEPRMSGDSIAAYLRSQVPDIYVAIMGESDSLLISATQMDKLQAARSAYRSRVDSVWQVASSELASMGSDYDATRGMHVIDEATSEAWLRTRDELAVLSQILTPVQMQLAPWIPALEKTLGKPTVDIRLLNF
jgi:hypothetical protein